MELNRDQIIYCLEQDIECGCGMYREVDVTDLKRALALIKELTEENARLSKALNTDISIVRVSRGSGKTAHLREVGRIRADAIRADTVREMRSEIERRCVEGGIYPAFVARVIEDVEREMLGEKDV